MQTETQLQQCRHLFPSSINCIQSIKLNQTIKDGRTLIVSNSTDCKFCVFWILIGTNLPMRAQIRKVHRPETILFVSI